MFRLGHVGHSQQTNQQKAFGTQTATEDATEKAKAETYEC